MSSKPLDLVEFLILLIDTLQSAGIDYMIGGAIAGWAWGEPRATQDLDLVVNIPIDRIVALSNELKKRDMLVPPEIILDALIENSVDLPINAIHMYSGLKADLYPVRAEDELRQAAFRRKQEVDFGEPVGRVFVHSPEDLIIYKLIYFSISEQPKHIRDITAILRAQKNLLDLDYIEKWVNRLGLTALWNELFGNAGWE
ncbi:MAG: hypothetical protein P8074_18705 [Anaerolineales bacterium]|jgi:hypothetical protein